jgi:hypothetical protein
MFVADLFLFVMVDNMKNILFLNVYVTVSIRPLQILKLHHLVHSSYAKVLLK